jgi:hypothetical protein
VVLKWGQVLNLDIFLKTAEIEIMGPAVNVKIQDLTPSSLEPLKLLPTETS